MSIAVQKIWSFMGAIFLWLWVDANLHTVDHRAKQKKISILIASPINKTKKIIFFFLCYTNRHKIQGQISETVSRGGLWYSDLKDKTYRRNKVRDKNLFKSEDRVLRWWKKYFEKLVNNGNERERRTDGGKLVDQEFQKIRFQKSCYKEDEE